MIATELIGLTEIEAAQKRIAGVAIRTGLYKLEGEAASKLPYEIRIKAESEQPIGSFKLRGAFNKVASLDKDALSRGVITYSSGNHAQGVAYAGRELGSKAVIVMPENAPIVKREATLALGAEVVLVGPASKERKEKAEQLEAEHGYTMVPPYDDPYIVAGQATCGAEIVDQAPDVDVVLSPVSGGGLLSGISTAVKLKKPSAKVFGVEPEVAGDATESFAKKELVEWPAEKTVRTIADGLRTQSLGVLNFAHVLEYTDNIFTVSEEEILAALKVYLNETNLVPEPSGAVTLAGALFHPEKLPAGIKKVVVVLSGGNIDPALKAQLLAR